MTLRTEAGHAKIYYSKTNIAEHNILTRAALIIKSAIQIFRTSRADTCSSCTYYVVRRRPVGRLGPF